MFFLCTMNQREQSKEYNLLVGRRKLGTAPYCSARNDVIILYSKIVTGNVGNHFMWVTIMGRKHFNCNSCSPFKISKRYCFDYDETATLKTTGWLSWLFNILWHKLFKDILSKKKKRMPSLKLIYFTEVHSITTAWNNYFLINWVEIYLHIMIKLPIQKSILRKC